MGIRRYDDSASSVVRHIAKPTISEALFSAQFLLTDAELRYPVESCPPSGRFARQNLPILGSSAWALSLCELTRSQHILGRGYQFSPKGRSSTLNDHALRSW